VQQSSADEAKFRQAFDAYFTAVNRYCLRRIPADDVNDDATYAAQYPGDPAGPLSRTEWEEELVWSTAQGTIMTPHECAVTEEAPGAVTVTCEHGTRDAPNQAVETVAVPTTTTMKITSDGIGEFHELYGRPDFTFVGELFNRWMEGSNSADAPAAGYGPWWSVEEAAEHGGIRANC
jgi:hypothetical protein